MEEESSRLSPGPTATRSCGRRWRKGALAAAVIDQTGRRLLRGQAVPAEEKIVFFFEPHTDIIVKGPQRNALRARGRAYRGPFGAHSGPVIESGNPADSTRAVPMSERQATIYGRVPRQPSFDGGYASKANLAAAGDGNSTPVEPALSSSERALIARLESRRRLKVLGCTRDVHLATHP